MTTLAPIALFVYNRPAHTRQTVEALQKNAWAKESDMIAFSDAPKTPESTQAMREVRDYIGAYPFPNMLEAQIKGENDSWAVRWYASAFLAGKLTLYPGRSLVHNIGNDNSGTHCGESASLDAELGKTPISLNAIKVEPSQEGRQAFERFFKQRQTGLLRRFVHKASALLKGCR